MLHHTQIAKPELTKLLKSGKILFGGNKNLKIYGTLTCKSGKRMKISNRVFFATEQEALEAGYRPCGHCAREEYASWKSRGILAIPESQKASTII
jgi:methylphosphotriester-DNA--protein-cysteine methyltransferase